MPEQRGFLGGNLGVQHRIAVGCRTRPFEKPRAWPCQASWSAASEARSSLSRPRRGRKPLLQGETSGAGPPHAPLALQQVMQGFVECAIALAVPVVGYSRVGDLREPPQPSGSERSAACQPLNVEEGALDTPGPDGCGRRSCVVTAVNPLGPLWSAA